LDRGGVPAAGRQLAPGPGGSGGPPGWSPGRSGQVVVGDDLVGRLEAGAGAEQDGRPPDGVEPDVVLADEVAVPGRWAVPPGSPGVRVAMELGPLDRGRQGADDGVAPDVEPAVVPAAQGHAPA